MDELISRLSTALASVTCQTIPVAKIDRGIHRLSIAVPPLDIYIYPHHVENRIPPLTSQYKTIHLDEDVLYRNLDKIVARLKTMMGAANTIFARNTVVARIDKKVALAFQQEHHLQEALPGKYRYGLYHEGELVSIAVFSGGRKMNDRPEEYRSFELLRFCHKNDILTVGGLSKLIKSFQQDFKPGDIMTYVDLDWTQDSSLKQIGFREEKRIEPQSFLISEEGHRVRSQESRYKEGLYGRYLKKNSGSMKLVLHLVF